MKKGFTLIEILVVATIIGLLATGGFVSYTQFGRQSRDARRKADLEQIRAAIEMYRSNSATNSYPASITFACPPSGSLTDGTTTYLDPLPNDPKCVTGWSFYTYTYLTAQTYTITAMLEGSGGSGTNYTLHQ